MNIDPYTGQPIHHGGIWRSDCLGKETQIQNFFYTTLANLGWTQQDTNHKIWRKDSRTVVVCLVDDLRSCSDNKHTDLPYLFDRNTIVITDGYIGCPTQYQVWKLPSSFFGIYSNSDTLLPWQPALNYAFSINRIDTRRLKLVLELAKRIHLHKGYVNFNCQYDHQRAIFDNHSYAKENFDQHWNYLGESDQILWKASYDLLKPQVPLKNYNLTHEEIFSKSYINIECETYSADNSAAYSEKIFRLLTTATPWTCYAGRYGIAYLESIGFDCMSDLVNHNHYDCLKEVENKVGVFIWKSLQVSKELRSGDINMITDRCKQAAIHNKNLLEQFKNTWPHEFKRWQDTYLPQLT